MLSREGSTRAYQDYWVTMAEFWFKLARHAEEKESAVADHQGEADKGMSRPVWKARLAAVVRTIAPRVFQKLSARRFTCQRLPARTSHRPETLLKIQLIKFNLMVPADCEPT